MSIHSIPPAGAYNYAGQRGSLSDGAGVDRAPPDPFVDQIGKLLADSHEMMAGLEAQMCRLCGDPVPSPQSVSPEEPGSLGQLLMAARHLHARIFDYRDRASFWG